MTFVVLLIKIATNSRSTYLASSNPYLVMPNAIFILWNLFVQLNNH